MDIINSPLGKLGIKVEQNKITKITYFVQGKSNNSTPNPLTIKFNSQLQKYLADPFYQFHLPLHLIGTSFQKKVWQILSKIPVGEVKTYGEVAAELNSSPRAVGNACRQNPISIVIPCHRVVAKNGLGGYAGTKQGRLFAIKIFLLKHERGLGDCEH